METLKKFISFLKTMPIAWRLVFIICLALGIVCITFSSCVMWQSDPSIRSDLKANVPIADTASVWICNPANH